MYIIVPLIALLALIVILAESSLSICVRLDEIDVDKFKRGARDRFNTNKSMQTNCSYRFGYKLFSILGELKRPVVCRNSYLVIYNRYTTNPIVSYKFTNTRPNMLALDHLTTLFKSSLSLKYVTDPPRCPVYSIQ